MAVLEIKKKESDQYMDITPYIAHNGYSVVKNHLTSESRDINGNMSIDIITAKRKISCNLIPMKADTLKNILSLIGGYEVQVQFLDPATNEMAEIIAYAEDVSPGYYTVNEKIGTLINGFTLNFTELEEVSKDEQN